MLFPPCLFTLWGKRVWANRWSQVERAIRWFGKVGDCYVRPFSSHFFCLAAFYLLLICVYTFVFCFLFLCYCMYLLSLYFCVFVVFLYTFALVSPLLSEHPSVLGLSSRPSILHCLSVSSLSLSQSACPSTNSQLVYLCFWPALSILCHSTHLLTGTNIFYLAIAFFLSLLFIVIITVNHRRYYQKHFSFIIGENGFNQFYSHIHVLIHIYTLLSSFCIKCQTLRKD